jgi:mRNA deadenylase 3'-5' endonuclease subunit Ccr4
LIDYNADIIFLQECEIDFFKEDLVNSMPDYDLKFKVKGDSREGEAILFRSDRFKYNLIVQFSIQTLLTQKKIQKKVHKHF